MHYVIGDVHGHFKTLLALLDKLPEHARPVFVGDLIDRGRQSAEVVRHVRENGYACVMGNHEEQMITYGKLLSDAYRYDRPLGLHNTWFSNGGVATLRSYGVIDIVDGKPVKITDFEVVLERFESDMTWMRELPLYVELDAEHASGLPPVVSHAPVAGFWNMRHASAMADTFFRMATTNRREPDEGAPVFNIFGHSPRAHGPDVQGHYANVDTGCYVEDGAGMGKLCAYCVETGETVCQANIG